MMRALPVLLLMLAGCVQAGNQIPDDDRPSPVVPTPDAAVTQSAQKIADSIAVFANPAHKEPLRRYAALYSAAADALEQSNATAGKVLLAVQKMPTEFVHDTIPDMKPIVVQAMPPTQDPEKNRKEIVASFRTLSQGCLLASEKLR